MTPEPRRLHPAAIGAEALAQLRGLALPIVVAALVGGGGDLGTRALVFAALGAAAAIAIAWVQWSTTRWRVEGATVRLRRGVLTVNETSVPFDRVQAIDTVRGPVQRLFGVVELHVQAAGGGREGEVVLRAVTTADAEALREAIRVAGPPGPDAPAGEEVAPAALPSWRLAPRALVVAALTSGSLGVLVPVVAGASQVLDDVIGAEDAERLVPDTLGEAGLLAAAVLALAWLLSVLGTVVAFARFRVTRDGERLRIARGVVERREQSVPVARVSAVRVVESPLRQPFGLATVRLETAGYAREAAAAQTLLPLVRRRDVPALLDRLLPELAGPTDGLERPPVRARRRAVVPPVAAALALAAVAVALAGPPGLLALALVPLGAAYGLSVFAAAGWRLDGGRLVVRGRRLARSTAVADAHRLPEVGLRATPLQRRAGLARVAVAVSSGRRAGVDDLDRATADALLARLGALARG